MMDAAFSSPTYISNHRGRMSRYCCHQPGVLAWRARASSSSRSTSSVTPYRVSRSATSRCLAPLLPRSRRLILEWVARIASAASATETWLSSRSRRSWAPSAIRSAVGPLRAATSARSACARAGATRPAWSEFIRSSTPIAAERHSAKYSTGPPLPHSRPLRAIADRNLGRRGGQSIRAGYPGRSVEQVVELTVLDAPDERVDLSRGVDERRAVGVTRVAYGDFPVRQFGDLHAAAVRVAEGALAPADPVKLRCWYAVTNL